jgi:hypothetical protein
MHDQYWNYYWSERSTGASTNLSCNLSKIMKNVHTKLILKLERVQILLTQI